MGTLPEEIQAVLAPRIGSTKWPEPGLCPDKSPSPSVRAAPPLDDAARPTIFVIRSPSSLVFALTHPGPRARDPLLRPSDGPAGQPAAGPRTALAVRPNRWSKLHAMDRRSAVSARCGLSVGVAVLVACAGGGVRAEVPQIGAPQSAPAAGHTALRYEREPGAEGCPAEAVFRERTTVGFDSVDPFVPSGTPATATLRVRLYRDGPWFVGDFSRMSSDGEELSRSTEKRASCEELVWALAFDMHWVILGWPEGEHCARAVCQGAQKQVPPAPPAPPSPPPPASSAAEPACDAACMQKVEAALCKKYGHCMDLTLAVMAGGLMTAGWSLDVGPGAWLGFEVQRDWLSVGLEVRGLFPAAAIVYEDSPPTSDLVSFSGVLVPCARWKVLFGCAFVETGVQIFTVPGSTDGTENETSVLLSVGPRAGVDVPIAGGFSVRAFADLAFHPYGIRAEIKELSAPGQPLRVWETPIVNGMFGLGVAWSR